MKCRSTMRARSALGPVCLLALAAGATCPVARATGPTRAVGEEPPHAEAGWLGAWVRPAAATPAGDLEGLIVVGALPLSPADRAGLRPGDLILRSEGVACDDADRFLASIAARRAGDRVRLTIRRDARILPLDVRLEHARGPLLAPLPPGGTRATAGSSAWDDRPARLGVQVIGLTETLAPYFKVKPREGVLVTHVERNGPAARAGLQAGDVVLAFARRKVRSPEELREALRDAGAGKHEVRIQRRGKRKTMRMSLVAPAENEPAADIAIYLSPRDRERLRRGLEAGDPEAWRELARLRLQVESLRGALRTYEREARQGPAELP